MTAEEAKNSEVAVGEIKTELADLVNCQLAGRSSRLAIANSVFAKVTDLQTALVEEAKRNEELSKALDAAKKEPEKGAPAGKEAV